MTVLVTFKSPSEVWCRGISEDEDMFQWRFDSYDIAVRHLHEEFHNRPWRRNGLRYRVILNVPVRH